MFGSTWRVGRIGGIEIRIDTSWVIIALLITYSLFSQFDAEFPELAPVTTIALALGAAGLFFGSVLFHEMAHAVTAKARGIPVRGITLFMFGGATHAKVESRRARDEFLISVVGPLSSLLLAGVFYATAHAWGDWLPDPVLATFAYLAFVNFALAVFNIVPGFPLDGGRVLRSAIWHITGSFTRATRVATISGQVVGWGLVAVGIGFVALGGTGTGLWAAAIGVFLAQAARASARELEVRTAFENANAEDVMAAGIVSIPADITLREAAERYLTRYGHAEFPVVENNRTVGVVTRRAVNEVAPEEWSAHSVGDLVIPLDEQVTVSPGTRMDRIVGELSEGETRRVVVVRDGDVVGIITPGDVARWLQRWRSTRPAAQES